MDIDNIINDFNIDVKSTRLIKLPSLKPSTNLFKVNRPDLIGDLYIIDTVEGKEIACHPHIVGERLRTLAFNAALEAAKAINQLTAIPKVELDSIVVENVLRAAPGYELHTAFKDLNGGRSFRDVWIRPRYEKHAYRGHDEDASIKLNVIYEDFEALSSNREIVVLKPDTEATGRTSQKSIERIIRRCEDVGSRVREVILYGFMSLPGLELISETAERNNVKLVAFSMGNITDLAYNGYDMTLYGVDESHWAAMGKIKKLGSIVDVTTLKRYLPEFVPGSDQPGDWSNRQTSIYIAKDAKEPGGIKEHLQNSIKIIESLRQISDYTLWQEEIAKKELQLLHSCISRY